MTEREDIDALAGEYVLGTLDGGERRAADARRRTDRALDEAIQAWERRLAPLQVEARTVTPPADLFGKIEARLPSKSLPVAAGSNVVALERKVRRWQWATAASTALAAGIAALALLRPDVLNPRASGSMTYVGAFVANDELPRFMLTIDLAKRELTIRPVGAERLQGRTYQLWIASDQLGPAPRSLGVLDDGSAPIQRRTLNQFDVDLLRAATFGVSIEPAGGSPTGRPSPGALHTKLLPTSSL
jgi:anti-sigma-K factor RskA